MATITVPGILEGGEVQMYPLDGSLSFIVSRSTDAASPRLAEACGSGIPVGEVTVVDGVFTFHFQDVIVSAYDATGEGETVSFNFTAMSSAHQ